MSRLFCTFFQKEQLQLFWSWFLLYVNCDVVSYTLPAILKSVFTSFLWGQKKGVHLLYSLLDYISSSSSYLFTKSIITITCYFTFYYYNLLQYNNHIKLYYLPLHLHCQWLEKHQHYVFYSCSFSDSASLLKLCILSSLYIFTNIIYRHTEKKRFLKSV